MAAAVVLDRRRIDGVADEPPARRITNLNLRGAYDAINGVLQLNAGPRHRSKVRWAQPGAQFALIGVATADAQKMVLKVGGARYSNCGYAVVGRQMEGVVASILNDSKPTPYRRRRHNRKQCRKEISDWLSEPLAYDQAPRRDYSSWRYGGAALFQDAIFKKHFGRSYKELTGNRARNFAEEVAIDCQNVFDGNPDLARTYRFAAAIAQQSLIGRPDVFIYEHAAPILRQWREHALRSADPADPGAMDRIRGAGAASLELLWPEGGYDIRKGLDEKKFDYGLSLIHI